LTSGGEIFATDWLGSGLGSGAAPSLSLERKSGSSCATQRPVGLVMPSLPSVVPGALNFPWLEAFDFAMARPIPILKEKRLTVTPSVSVFNLFNFSNSFLPGNLPQSTLTPGPDDIHISPNAIGGVTHGSSLAPFLASFQSGTYALGAPRQFEFGLKIDF
jgi:hypothetical protein